VIAFEQYIEDLGGEIVNRPVMQGHLDMLLSFPARDISLVHRDLPEKNLICTLLPTLASQARNAHSPGHKKPLTSVALGTAVDD
jgi:hypothetical protein